MCWFKNKIHSLSCCTAQKKTSDSVCAALIKLIESRSNIALRRHGLFAPACLQWKKKNSSAVGTRYFEEDKIEWKHRRIYQQNQMDKVSREAVSLNV